MFRFQREKQDYAHQKLFINSMFEMKEAYVNIINMF